MTGTIATLIATLAIAAFGFAMLQGRLSVKAGARVVLGCFILFGAPFVAKELMPAQGRSVYGQAVYVIPVHHMPDVPAPSAVNPDPYAGASVPLP